MKVPQKHYTNFLISVQFDRRFMPSTLAGKKQQAENFLDDLGKMALFDGHRLHSTCSVVSGLNGCHAHFGVSWLPIVGVRVKTAKMSEQPIARYTVTRLLDENYFYVDNPKQAIKRVTHDKGHVTDYIIRQPKDGQTTLESFFYVHPIFVPVHSDEKTQSYCYTGKRPSSKIPPQNGCVNKLIANVFIILSVLIAISYVLLSIF